MKVEGTDKAEIKIKVEGKAKLKKGGSTPKGRAKGREDGEREATRNEPCRTPTTGQKTRQ